MPQTLLSQIGFILLNFAFNKILTYIKYIFLLYSILSLTQISLPASTWLEEIPTSLFFLAALNQISVSKFYFNLVFFNIMENPHYWHSVT